MGTPEIVVMSIFGLLVLGALAAAAWQGARQRKQAARYSSKRGFGALQAGDARLAALLGQVAPDSKWTPHGVMLVEPPPHGLYLFGYSSSRPSRSSTGYACVAEHDASRPAWPVAVFTRVPVIDKLVACTVETGGEDFRRKFTVTCSDAGAAVVTVNAEVQRILLDHAADPGWYLNVSMAGSGVLVESHWAETEQQWDYLIALAKRLRDALR